MKTWILGILLSTAINVSANTAPDFAPVEAGLPFLSDDSAVIGETWLAKPDYAHKYNRFSVGIRANYMKGKYDYVGVAIPVFWWCRSYDLPIEHIGFSAGFDWKISGAETVYAPKISFEYRYLVLVGRIGHQYYTDFKSRSEHRMFVEAGFSILGFLDVTYLHAFGFNGDPFHLRASNLNVTLTLPIPETFWKTGTLRDRKQESYH